MRDRSKDVCNYCKQLGHWYKDCKNFFLDILQKQKIEKGNIVEIEEAFFFALLVSHEIDAWYIDFGASMHLSFCREWFCDYENIFLIKIYMGNNSI
jgi:hypothetical protein